MLKFPSNVQVAHFSSVVNRGYESDKEAIAEIKISTLWEKRVACVLRWIYRRPHKSCHDPCGVCHLGLQTSSQYLGHWRCLVIDTSQTSRTSKRPFRLFARFFCCSPTAVVNHNTFIGIGWADSNKTKYQMISNWGFLKWWYPTSMGFPTKMIILGCLSRGYQNLTQKRREGPRHQL